MNTNQRLSGKTAIVTGACGGIGKETVRLFVEHGARVIAADLADRDAGVVQSLLAQHPGVDYRRLDIASEEEVTSFFTDLSRDHASIDVLVNNAGIILGKPLAETSVAEWDRLTTVNSRGTFLMIRGVLPLINKQTGSVINISSGAALRPLRNLSAYSASKAAINALTKAAAYELAPVRFNVVCPGPIDTSMPRRFVEQLSRDDQARVFEDLGSVRALKRLGLPAEIASVVLFLASDEASYVTGAEMNIDGGKP